jgi:hypothetical protein
LYRRAILVRDEPEQEVLRANIVVPERERLSEAEFKHLLRASREGNLAAWLGRALPDHRRHISQRSLDSDPKRREHLRGNTLFGPQQAQEQMLGADLVVLEATSLHLSHHNDLTRTLCKALKHKRDPSRRWRVKTSSPVRDTLPCGRLHGQVLASAVETARRVCART